MIDQVEQQGAWFVKVAQYQLVLAQNFSCGKKTLCNNVSNHMLHFAWGCIFSCELLWFCASVQYSFPSKLDENGVLNEILTWKIALGLGKSSSWNALVYTYSISQQNGWNKQQIYAIGKR